LLCFLEEVLAEAGGERFRRDERRIDDRAPEANKRADLYQPGGFDRSLPDYADVSLRR